MLFGLRHLSRKILWIFFTCLCLSFFLLLYAIYLITLGLKCFPGRIAQPSSKLQLIAVCFNEFKIEIKKFLFQLYLFCIHFRNHVTQSQKFEVSVAFADSNNFLRLVIRCD